MQCSSPHIVKKQLLRDVAQATGILELMRGNGDIAEALSKLQSPVVVWLETPDALEAILAAQHRHVVIVDDVHLLDAAAIQARTKKLRPDAKISERTNAIIIE